MKRLFSYQFPLIHSHSKNREGLILQWNDGWGEIAPLPRFSKETLADALAEILTFWPNLDAAKPTLPSVQWGLFCASKPFPLKPISLPLASLGPAPAYSTLKLKLGPLSTEDAVLLVKQHLPHHRLRLDCNRAWPLEKALAFARHFKKTDFDYLEEPTNDLARFSRLTEFPVAIDESINSNWSDIPTLKAIVVKPTLTGFVPTIPPHLDLILSSAYETGLGLLHIAHAATNDLPIGLDTYKFLKEDLLNSPIVCEKGRFSWQPCTPPFNLTKLTCLLAH